MANSTRNVEEPENPGLHWIQPWMQPWPVWTMALDYGAASGFLSF